MTIPISDLAHLRLTVTDIARSRAFYDAVFGLPVLYEAPPADASESEKARLSFLFGGVIYLVGGKAFGLRPVAPAGDRFDEDRLGLDHLSFAVPGVADLEAAIQLLDELGIAHSEVKNIGSGSIVEFRDPDNIALELFTLA